MFGRLAVLRMLAARLALRERRAPPGVVRTQWICAATVVATLGLVLAGSSSLTVVALLGASSLVLLASTCLRFFPTSMAVSVVGVALSCASLMTALSVTTGFRLEITRSMVRFNGHVLLTKYGLDFFEYDEIADQWERDPRVRASSPFAFSMAAMVGGVSPPAGPGAATTGGFLGEPSTRQTEDAQDAARMPAVVIGKGLDPRRAAAMDGIADMMGRGDLAGLRPGDTFHPPGIILGDGLARAVDVEVGDYVRLVVPAELDGTESEGRAPRHATFEVLDIFHTGTSEFDRSLALMHITAAQSVFFREGRVTGIEFQLHEPDHTDEVAKEMQAALGYPYRVSTWYEANAGVLTGLAQIRATLSLVLGLMVIVASASLIASLLLIVRRKRHDIAVLMSLGAKRSLVFWAFESIGLLVGCTGAMLGIALGALYCLVISAYRYPLGADIYPVDHLPVIVEPVDVLGPTLAAIVLCGLASGPIATLASRVRVLEALRR